MIAATATRSRGTNMRGGVFLGTLPVRSIAIVGAGVSGWLVAATLKRVLGADCTVTVVSLPDDSVISGALAAVPSLHRLLGLLGADEPQLMRATQATFRLGTQFTGWGAPQQRYFQGFGSVGARLDAVPFQHHWLRLALNGDDAPFEAFSIAAQLARLDRFAPPHNDPRSVLSLFSYGWHFDAKLLADVLRELALRLGAQQRSGAMRVELGASGDIAALIAGEERIAADFFVDCSGTRAALAQPLGADYEDWSQWLPCDRLQYVQPEAAGELRPYSEFEAQPAGWRFSLPLQRQTVRGYVYASEFTDDAAIAEQLASWSGTAATPALHSLMRGRPREFWLRNCLLMPGEALEPLESVGLHLAQTGITRWLAHFPAHTDSPTDRGEYNRLTAEEYDRIRDLLVLHYHAGSRDDSPFWRHCRGIHPPEALARRIALFSDSARLTIGEDEHCSVDGWLAVLLGQGLRPASYDPLAEATPLDTARTALAKMAAEMRARASQVPLQRDYLARAGILAPGSRA